MPLTWHQVEILIKNIHQILLDLLNREWNLKLLERLLQIQFQYQVVVLYQEMEYTGSVVTVTTPQDHGLNVGTPIKIKGVTPIDYNISTKVATVASSTQFTYVLPFVEKTTSNTKYFFCNYYS